MATILITGCSSGLGQFLLEKLSQEGHKVIATVRSVESVSAQENHSLNSVGVSYLRLDITSEQSIKAMVAELSANRLTPDIVLLNAGTYAEGTVESSEENIARECFEVNFWGNMNLLRQLLPFMRKRGSGKIIGISSMSSFVGLPCDALYAASKAAFDRMLESLSYEIAPFGISVSSLVPLSFPSDLFSKVATQTDQDSPYYKLLANWQKGLKTMCKSGTDKEQHLLDILDTIKAIIVIENPDFLYPANAMAKDIIAQLGRMTKQERKAAVISWSNTSWWHSSVN